MSILAPAAAPASTHAKARRKISWDLVRVLCVLCVVVYHSTHTALLIHPEFTPRRFSFPWQVGASMLLLISAYFACASLRKGDTLRYWWNRISRLLPPFLAAALVTFIVLRLAAPEGWFVPTGRNLVENWLMLWHVKPAEFTKIDESYWTVPLQLMAFTAAALLWRSGWGRGHRLRGVLWVAVLVPMIQWPYRIQDPPEMYRMLVDGLGFHRYHLFVAGVAIWLFAAKRLSAAHFAALLATCMIAHAMHNQTLLTGRELGSTIAVCLGMLIIAVVAAGPDWDRVVPRAWFPAIGWLAGISYGVFLMHQTLGYIVMRHLQDVGFGALAQTAAMLATGVVAGWLLTRLVEQPAHSRLLRGFDRARSERQASYL